MAKLHKNFLLLREMVGSKLTKVRKLGGYTFLEFDGVTDQMFCLEEGKFWDYEEIVDQLTVAHENVRFVIKFRRQQRIDAVAEALEKANAPKKRYM